MRLLTTQEMQHVSGGASLRDVQRIVDNAVRRLRKPKLSLSQAARIALRKARRILG